MIIIIMKTIFISNRDNELRVKLEYREKHLSLIST